jgi:N-acyl homoserine lactone hydrolase
MGGLRLTAVDAGPFRLEKSKLVAFAEGMVSIPTTVGIIEHPRHGLVLWDTGVNHVVADPEAGGKYWASGVREAFGAQGFTREHAIDKQLEKLGFKTADVRYVIYSHLHIDHAGGMCYFPKAVHVVQRDEIRYAMWPDARQRPTYSQNDFADIWNKDVTEVEGDVDLFNDGTLRLLKTPGPRSSGPAVELAASRSGLPRGGCGSSARRVREHDADAVGLESRCNDGVAFADQATGARRRSAVPLS